MEELFTVASDSLFQGLITRFEKEFVFAEPYFFNAIVKSVNS